MLLDAVAREPPGGRCHDAAGLCGVATVAHHRTLKKAAENRAGPAPNSGRNNSSAYTTKFHAMIAISGKAEHR